MFSRKRILKKFFVLLTILTILGLNVRPFATAHAADSVASVSVLQGLKMDAVLGNVDKGTGPYTLNLTLTGTGTDAELVNPEKTVVIYADELAKLWFPNGQAHVRSELLPVTLDSLPLVTSTVSGVTDNLVDIVGQLNDVEEELVNYPVLNGLIQINGLTELSDAVTKLQGLDEALNGILVYEDDVAVTIDPDTGKVIVNFTDGLGNHLETTIQTVIDTLNEVIDAINGFSINVPVLNPVLDVILTGILDPILGVNVSLPNVEASVFGLVGQLTDDAVIPLVNELPDLLNKLASLQVLGKTVITVPLKVAKPSGLNQAVVIDGIVTDTSAIDLDVLSDEGAHATVTFNEKTDVVPTPVTTTPVTTTPSTTSGTTTTSGSTLPNTSTDMWMYGLTGISTLLAGIGTRRFARRK